MEQTSETLSFAHYSKRAWPVVVVTFRNTEVTDEQFEQHLHRFQKLLDQDEPFRVVFDLTNCSGVPMRFLPKQVKMLNANKDKIEHILDCSAIVLTQSWLRKLLGVFFTFYKLTKPNKVFDNVEDAKAWAEAFN